MHGFFRALAGAAALRAAEEYLFGWVDFARDHGGRGRRARAGRLARGVDFALFAAANAVFIPHASRERRWG